MIFPASNLSTSAQPWGRVVEKGITNLETLVATERVNNAARDAQATVNIRRLDDSVVGLAGTVQSIKTITDNVFVTGTTEINGYNIKAGTINAASINTGELVGFTIKTAASGTRLELAGTSLTTYYGSSVSGSVYGNVSPVDGSVAMILSSATSGGAVAVSNDNINIQTGAGSTGASIRVVRNSGITMYPGTGATVSISNGNLSVGGTIGGTTISGSSLSSSGTLSSSGAATLSANVFAPNLPSTSSAANMRWSTSGNGQFFYSTSSSARYKENIVDISTVESIDPRKLLELPVRGFRYKEDYSLIETDSRYQQIMPGFIAEEVAEFYPLAADYEGDVVESWNERMIVPGLLALVQDLYKRIEILEGA